MSTPAAHYHGIDIANLNALVTDIRGRLSGGLTGDFYEKGGAGIPKEGARHAQLPLLFNAMAKIETLVGAMEKQAAIADAEEKEAQKPAGKPNKNMMATIKEMVQGEVEAKTRTVAIETERLMVKVQNLEMQNSQLVDEVASLKAKVKKGGGQSISGLDEKHRTLSKKIGALEEAQEQQYASSVMLADDVDALRGRHAARGDSRTSSAPPITVSGLSEKLDELKLQLEDHQRDHASVWASKNDLEELREKVASDKEAASLDKEMVERRHKHMKKEFSSLQDHLGLRRWVRPAIDDAEVEDDEDDNTKSAAKSRSRPHAAAAPQSGPGKILVNGLPDDVTEALIEEFFSVCGPVQSVSIDYGPYGRSRGSASVLFARHRAASIAVRLDGVRVDGKALRIKIPPN